MQQRRIPFKDGKGIGELFNDYDTVKNTYYVHLSQFNQNQNKTSAFSPRTRGELQFMQQNPPQIFYQIGNQQNSD